jgi:hypothetical protein
MTLLKDLYLSYNVNHVFEGILPDLDSFTDLEWLFATSDVYPVATSAAFVGVFPNITQMANFTGCKVVPSNLCRYADVDVSVYENVPEGCDAGQLPVCSEDFLAALATARAVDQYGAPLDYQEEVDFLVAQFEADYDEAEAARRDTLTQEEKDAEDAALAEKARRDTLTQEERDAEDAALAEAARRDSLTQEEKDAEDEATRRAALTQSQRDAEDCDGSEYCLAVLSCAGNEECVASVANLAVEECDGDTDCLAGLRLVCDGDEACVAALEIKEIPSSARSSFAAPGLLTVALLVLAVL